jgi:uncharacterized protein
MATGLNYGRRQGSNFPAFKQVIVKITPRCNIACSYCYQIVFDHHKWDRLPRWIAPLTFLDVCDALFRHAKEHEQRAVNFVFQGGEPLLVPKRIFAAYAEIVDAVSAKYGIPYITSVQTNGLLIDNEWINLLKRLECGLAISIDGGQESHDARRRFANGAGTYDILAKKISLCLTSGLLPRALCVMNGTSDGAQVFHELEKMGFRSIGFIFPANNRKHPDVEYEPDSKPYGRFLVSAFDAWLGSTVNTRVHNFEATINAILGKPSSLAGVGDAIGDIVSVASDGSIEIGDSYGICEYERALFADPYDAVIAAAASQFSLLQRSRAEIPTVEPCRSCEFMYACRGGQLEHRYSVDRQYDNPSYYCSDLLLFYGHVAQRLRMTGLLRASNNERSRSDLGPTAMGTSNIASDGIAPHP